MMNKKTLVRLGVVCVVAIAASVAINRSRLPVSEHSAKAAALVDGLKEHINSITAVTIATPGQPAAVSLVQGDKGWQVASKGGYPADVGKLREYLLRVADSSLVEQKTASRERYPELGVSDLSEPGAKGIEVKVDGLAQPVDFIAGVYNTKSSGTYVRRAGEAQSWLASGNLVADRNAGDWLQKDLANISADRIASVTITPVDGKSLRVFKNAASDAQYSIADLPKGREPVSEYAANGLASALAELRIDDVEPASAAAQPERATRARYTTFDGVQVDATIWTEAEKTRVSFHAALAPDAAGKDEPAASEKAADGKADSGDGKKAGAEAAATESDEDSAEADKEDVAEAAAIDPEAEVSRLNAAFDGWYFVLPAHKVGNMTKTMDEMLKPLEPKAAQKDKKAAK